MKRCLAFLLAVVMIFSSMTDVYANNIADATKETDLLSDIYTEAETSVEMDSEINEGTEINVDSLSETNIETEVDVETAMEEDAEAESATQLVQEIKTTEEIFEEEQIEIVNPLEGVASEGTAYAITYVLNGGTNSSLNKDYYYQSDEDITLRYPSRTGYKFAGWFTDVNLKKQVSKIAAGSTGDVTLYAKWQVNTYTISFNGNGATSGSTAKIENCVYPYTYTLTSNGYKRAGYTFTGWNTKADGMGTAYANGAKVKSLCATNGGTIVLYAQWKENQYTITYNLNGGTNSNLNKDYYYTSNEDITLRYPSRPGYKFAGWFTDTSLKKQVSKIAAGSTGNVTLYAKWQVNTYSISFDGNGATSGSTAKIGNCVYPYTYTLTTNGYARTGYTFVGWNTKADGTGTSYANGAKVKSLCSTNGGTIVLYAQWELAKPVISIKAGGYDSLEISWTKTDAAEYYEVYRSGAETGEYSLVAQVDGSATTYTDSGLVLNSEYYYKVRVSIKTNEGSVYSPYSEIKKEYLMLQTPLLSWKNSGKTTAVLSWEAISLPMSNSGYCIFRITDEGEQRIDTVSSEITEYAITGLAYGETIDYTVRAYVVNANAQQVYSDASNVVSVTAKLAAPESVSVSSASCTSAEIRWSINEDANIYYVYRRVSGGSFSKIAQIEAVEDVDEMSFTDERLETGKNYYYAVQSISEAENVILASEYSKTVGVCIAPPATQAFSIKSTAYNTINLYWRAVAGLEPNGKVSGYQIYRSTSESGTYTLLTTIKNGATVSYKDTSVTCGTTYYYKVRAYCNLGGKNVYGAFSEIRSQKTLPAVPTNLSGKTTSYNTIQLSWGKVSGVDRYWIFRSTSLTGTYTSLGVVANGSLKYTDSNAECGTSYYYKVRAGRKVGSTVVWSDYSEGVKVHSMTMQPQNVVATPLNSNRIKISWGKVNGAEEYCIYRSTAKNGTYTLVASTTDINYTDTELQNGMTYYYKIAGKCGAIIGYKSSAISSMAANLALSSTNMTLFRGETKKIYYTATPTSNATWKSANTSIVKVDSAGKITAVGAGTTYITVTANGISQKITVNVILRLNGIDVSKWQGNIDFAKVKAAGYDYVMIRVYSGSSIDPYFETNYANARAAGLKVGVYSYSLATSIAEANQEAQTVLRILNGRHLDFPVAMDLEDDVTLNATTNAERTNMVHVFKNAITDAGYDFILYANYNWLNNYLDNSRLNGVDIWIARYCDTSLGHRYTGGGNVTMWQYTSTGKVNGISGNVDLDYGYKMY